MIPLFLYSLMTVLFSPVIFIWLGVRLYRKKEDFTRFNERMGFPSVPRPQGRLIWLHGASVGECLSMLPLIEEILHQDKNAYVMVTSGTTTSATLMQKRLPKRAFHQYIPVDFPWAANRFVKHWNADAILWFESDFWPNLLSAVHKNKKPLILLNGRISDRSFERWQRAKWFISPLIKKFSLCFGQTNEDAKRLKELGATDVTCVGNLKFSAIDPSFDEVELNKLLDQIGGRPRAIAASTHEIEEEIFVGFHSNLKNSFADYLSILVPRHPHRADEIEKICLKKGLSVSRRSRGEDITPKTDVYLADTIGEMGMLYRLAPIVFVGGSLIPFGGQNMLEPMRLSRVVIVGPHTFNFREIVKEACIKGALIQVKTPSEVLGNIDWYLSHRDEMEDIQRLAQTFASSQMAVLDRVYETLQNKAVLK